MIFSVEVMKRFSSICLLAMCSLTSCGKSDSQLNVDKEEALTHQIGVWCPFEHDDLQKSGDSVLIFSEEHGNASMYTLIMRRNNRRNYNATFYEGDPLNALYNVIEDTPGVKVFFEAVAFRIEAKKLEEIEKRFDELFDVTGPESTVDMIDGWSFLVTRRGKTKRVNDGPMVEKWKEYSDFLRDSVISPLKELREKGREESTVSH